MPVARPIRLLVVTPRYLPLVGGVENHVREVVRRLPPAIEPCILTADPSGALQPQDAVDGVPVTRVRAYPERRDYLFAPALPRAVAESGCDLVHVQSYHTAVAPLAMTAALGAGIPYVVTFHGGGHSSAVRALLRRPQWAALRPLLARAERLVAVADFEAALFAERLHLPMERFAVIPNGADLPDVAGDDTPEPGGGPYVIGSVGRLERYKGHHRIIAAMPAVLAAEPDARLDVIGSGPYEAELRALAERLGVADRVRIRSIPAEDRATMGEAMRGMSLLVSMSEFETHPLAVIEAAALGRPALVADGSGLRELADKGVAERIPLDATPARLAASILETLRHPPETAPFQPPTWEECAASLASLYAEVVRDAAPAVAASPGGRGR